MPDIITHYCLAENVFQRLPDKLKEAVVLIHYHQLNKKEAAAALHISRAALDRRLAKAYKALGYREEVSTDEA